MGDDGETVTTICDAPSCETILTTDAPQQDDYLLIIDTSTQTHGGARYCCRDCAVEGLTATEDN